MRTGVLILSVLILVGGVSACGGGGSSDEPSCNQPQATFTLALLGDPAPGTAGTFSSFGTTPLIAAARGGWGAFVAGTTDPVKGVGAWVAEPDGNVVLALAEGDAAPGLGGHTIADVRRIWLGEGGWLVAWVDLLGGGSAEGLISVLVDNGAVQETNGLAYLGASVPVSGGSQALLSFDEPMIRVARTGRVFFGGTTVLGDGLWKIEPDGSSLAFLVGAGSSLVGIDQVDLLRGIGIAGTGQFYAFLAVRDDGGSSLGLYLGQVGVFGFDELAEEGDFLDQGEEIGDLPQYQPIELTSISGDNLILFKAVSNLLNDYLLAYSENQGGLLNVASEGGDAPGTTPPGGSPAPYGELDWINNAMDPLGPMFVAELPTVPNGVSLIVYALFDLSRAPGLPVYDGFPAPSAYGTGVTFTENFLGLGDSLHRRIDNSRGGSLAFVNALSNGTVAAFWRIPGCGMFTIARPGQTIPGGGDTFSQSDAWRVTTANGVAVFFATTDTAGSGIFRRGP